MNRVRFTIKYRPVDSKPGWAVLIDDRLEEWYRDWDDARRALPRLAAIFARRVLELRGI